MRRTFRLAIDVFPHRLSAIAILAVFCMTLIAIRLFVRSVTVHADTQARAEQQYLVSQAVEPHRGKIYAVDEPGASLVTRAVKPLATNRRAYALSVVPKNVKDKQAAAEILAPWAELSVGELFDRINSNRLYLPPLRGGYSGKPALNEAEKDQLADLNMPGLLLIEEEERYYPEGQLASQILGFVNAEKQGSYGIEQHYHTDLRGSGGEILGERDVRGRILATEDKQPVRDGSDVFLTIDRNVQGFVETTLKKALATYEAISGSVVVMDVTTGAIVAMASAPDFDPNRYGEVLKEEQSRFLNSAVSAVWEPGSIFKTIVMALALDAGLVEPDTEGVFSNQVSVGGYQIHTAEDKAFGRETMTQVLENSDNVAMVWLADQLGNDRFYQGLEKFGIGEELGIDLPGEVGGSLLPLAAWHDIERATMAFGQGVSVTPLQIVSAFATMANGGTLMQPHIAKGLVLPDGAVTEFAPKVLREQVIRAETATKITAMMESVVVRGHGKRAGVKGYRVAGKTGTAQVPDPVGGYYTDRHIGGFAGFFPADQPRFAMVVKLDEPKTVKFAESSAAPTFGEIAQFILTYYRIPPTEPLE